MFGSPERKLVFDVNDFDETLPGPWEWDVKRLAASVEIAARERGFSDVERRAAVLAAGEWYRKSMLEFAQMPNLDLWYRHLDVDEALATHQSELTKVGRKRTSKEVAKALTRDSLEAFNKLTSVVEGERRIISNPPTLVPIEELLAPNDSRDLTATLKHLLASYRRSLQNDRKHLLDEFRFVQAARKVVGVGSVGTRAWIILFLGRDGDDPLFLQAKEAEASVLERFTRKSEYTNCGERVVSGQRLMQASSDIFLGWQHTEAGLDGKARDFYIRQLRDWKGSVDPETMLPSGLKVWSQVCAWTLARAHARSGDRIAIASYLGQSATFENAIASFAESYAEQNQRDYDEMRKAVASRRITAEMGI